MGTDFLSPGKEVVMRRRMFCELSPLTYQISVQKGILLRRIKDSFASNRFAETREDAPLPFLVYTHKSLIRRRLGNVNMELQENKAVNLALAAPKIDHILIRPGETFSFWRLVGDPSAKNGYREGLTISVKGISQGIGGGMCQFTNLLHWMFLHTPLTIEEHHHHDGVDLFPDYNRQIPFGTGTSIVYNYVDYRVKNNTDATYQIVVYTTDEYLCGALRADRPQPYKYHIRMENEYFSREGGTVYRNGKVIRETIDPVTGNRIQRELLRTNHAKVLYDTSHLNVIDSGDRPYVRWGVSEGC